MQYVLYAFDENYAPYAAVSLCSLCEQSKNTPFTVLCVADGVCAESKARLAALAAHYGRALQFADADAVTAELDACGIPAYRGAKSANVRLFPACVLPTDATRVVYLDCDTIVCGELAPLFATPLEGAPVAAVRDSLTARYKRLLGFAEGEPYFNSGVLLIDLPRWQELRVSERIKAHCLGVRARYCNPDQDLLNLVLKGEIASLPPACNLQPHHCVFDAKTYLRVYGEAGYYTASELEAARKAPLVLHAYRFLGSFPWHAKSKHPGTPLWDTYLAKTPWNGVEKKPAEGGLVFAVERLLYRILPRRAFLSLFARVTHRRARKADKKAKKE